MKISYKDIKDSYLEVKFFLEDASRVKVTSLNTKIAEDLSLWGDDNYELLVEFKDKYKVEFKDFDYSEHFESEGELFNSTRALIALVSMPFEIILWILKLFFPNIKINFSTPFIPKINERKDLTFGDLITSKLKGEFCLRKKFKIELTK